MAATCAGPRRGSPSSVRPHPGFSGCGCIPKSRRLLALVSIDGFPGASPLWALQSRSIAPLTRVARVAPGLFFGQRAPALRPGRARPLVPRPSLPSQLALPGRAPAAGAATAAAPGPRVSRPSPGDPARGGGSPEPTLDRHSSLTLPEKFVPLHFAEPLREPRRDEGFPYSPCWCGQAPSIGWGSPYEGRWQPELIQLPWSGARTPAEEGSSV